MSTFTLCDPPHAYGRNRSDEPRFESDKLTESYTLRIPAITKRMIDKLSKAQIKQLNERIMVTMASCLHQARFEPSFYLIEDYDDRGR